jgi:hypothetical protein
MRVLRLCGVTSEALLAFSRVLASLDELRSLKRPVLDAALKLGADATRLNLVLGCGEFLRVDRRPVINWSFDRSGASSRKAIA